MRICSPLGCPVDGETGDDPTVVDCVAHFVDEDLSLEMLKTIVPLGADVNSQLNHLKNWQPRHYWIKTDC